MSSRRIERVAEAIRETLSQAILYEMKDPRVGFVTVVRVEVSPDLQQAKVYVSVMGDASRQRLAMHGLRHAAGFLQARVGQRLQTKHTPILQFIEDESVKRSIEISRLIDQAVGKSRAADDRPAEDADGSASR